MLVTEPRDRGDLVRRRGPHDQLGRTVLFRRIGPVLLEGVRRLRAPVGSDRRPNGLDEVWLQHAVRTIVPADGTPAVVKKRTARRVEGSGRSSG